MVEVKYRDMRIKTINDKFTILTNEILNLISVANYMYRGNDLNNIGEEVKEILDNLIGENKEEIEKIDKSIKKGIYEIEKFNLKDEGNPRELKTAIRTLIQLLKRCVYGLNYINRYYFNKDVLPLDDLLFFSFLEEKEILDILSNINVISKLLKFRRENAQQIYIPSSLLHRRYRLYNNQKFMNNLIYNKVKKFLGDNSSIFKEEGSVEFILTSDYNIGETLDSKNTKNLTLIKGSFFWRELFRFQPIMFHEIAHTMQNLLREDVNRKYEEFVEEIYAKTKDIDSVFFPLEDLKRIKNELFADLVATYMLGDAYILSLFNYGLIGLYFYETLADFEKEVLEKDKNNEKNIYKRVIYYKFPHSDVRFIPKRETNVLRFIILYKLREILKNRKGLKEKFTVVSSDYWESVKEYMFDFFPFEDYYGMTYSFTTESNKRELLYIAKYTDYLSEEFLGFFEENFRFKSEYSDDLETGEDIYYFKEKEKKGEKFYVKSDNEKILININLKDKEKGDYDDIEMKFFDDDNKKYARTDIYNLMWRIVFSQMHEILKEDPHSFIGKSLKDGRVFGTYQITKYKPLGKIVKDFIQKNKVLKLNVGFIGFVKGKGFYEKNSIKENLNSFFKEIKKIDKSNYMMGPHDLYIYDFIHTKRIEKDIYLPLIKYKAFIDIHSILKVEQTVPNEKPNSENGNTLIDKLWAFSFGWEDIILYEKRLENIFNTKSFILSRKADIGIERTETLISYRDINDKEFTSFILTKISRRNGNINFSQEIDKSTSTNGKSEYKLIVNLRVKNITESSEDVENELFSEFEKHYFPGRYDMVLFTKGCKEDIMNQISNIIGANIDKVFLKIGNKKYKVEIEDVVLDILKPI